METDRGDLELRLVGVVEVDTHATDSRETQLACEHLERLPDGRIDLGRASVLQLESPLAECVASFASTTRLSAIGLGFGAHEQVDRGRGAAFDPGAQCADRGAVTPVGVGILRDAVGVDVERDRATEQLVAPDRVAGEREHRPPVAEHTAHVFLG